MFYASTKAYPLDYSSVGKLVVDPAIATLDVFTLSGFMRGCGDFTFSVFLGFYHPKSGFDTEFDTD